MENSSQQGGWRAKMEKYIKKKEAAAGQKNFNTQHRGRLGWTPRKIKRWSAKICQSSDWAGKRNGAIFIQIRHKILQKWRLFLESAQLRPI